MILGLGSDMVDIRRIEKTIARFGDRFTHRIYTARERTRADARPDAGLSRDPGRGMLRAASYAKRFAAKEACSKALGTGFRRGVYWRDIGVVNLPSGRPTLALTGGALAALTAMTPPGTTARIELTLTDDYPYAQAIVIISGIKDKNDGR